MVEPFIRSAGYEISVRRIEKIQDSGLNLNISPGAYIIPGFKSLDIYTPHYYKSKEDFLKTRVEYDLRSDSIPFESDSVDNIFISHAIEHVETFAVERFFTESYRVLTVGGVLRVCCPDAKFLYSVSCFDNEYWTWRERRMKKDTRQRYDPELSGIQQSDFLIRELATPKMRFYRNSLANTLGPFNVAETDYETLSESLRSDLIFRSDHPGDHINNWDFKRVEKLGKSLGFSHVIESKHCGSVSARMQSGDFDQSNPQLSLYVDLVK